MWRRRRRMGKRDKRFSIYEREITDSDTTEGV